MVENTNTRYNNGDTEGVIRHIDRTRSRENSIAVSVFCGRRFAAVAVFDTTILLFSHQPVQSIQALKSRINYRLSGVHIDLRGTDIAVPHGGHGDKGIRLDFPEPRAKGVAQAVNDKFLGQFG